MRHLRLVSLCGFFLFSSNIFPQEPLDPAQAHASLKGLPMGQSYDQTLEFLKKRIDTEYTAMISRTMDVREKDRLLDEAKKRKEQVGSETVKFEGERGAWDASPIIKGEFSYNNDEKMLIWREGESQFYLFFWKDILYKLIWVPPTKTRDDIYKEIIADYGKPSTEKYADDNKEKVVMAQWSAGKLQLTLEEKPLAGVIVLRWVLKDKDEEIKAEWKKKAGGSEPENPLLKKAIEPSKEGDESSPVDEIIGGKEEDKTGVKEPPKEKGKKKKSK